MRRIRGNDNNYMCGNGNGIPPRPGEPTPHPFIRYGDLPQTELGASLPPPPPPPLIIMASFPITKIRELLHALQTPRGGGGVMTKY